jgi:hypothetical protein
VTIGLPAVQAPAAAFGVLLQHIERACHLQGRGEASVKICTRRRGMKCKGKKAEVVKVGDFPLQKALFSRRGEKTLPLARIRYAIVTMFRACPPGER